MEQYIHLLIPENAAFTPTPQQVAAFFVRILQSSGFQILTDKPGQPGLVALKPTGRNMVMKNPYTGETIETNVPRMERFPLQKPDELPSVIDALPHYRVLLSGQWVASDRPLALFTPDGASFEDPYLCSVFCQQRPEPVSMSYIGDEDLRAKAHLPRFGEPCPESCETGHFTNPWTGSVFEISGAGSARFWIEFEFGKFIYPRMSHGLDSIAEPLLAAATDSFGTLFKQGCRYH